MSYNNAITSGVLTETVPRTALLKKMKEISAERNIYMFAPGGYGKSVAAAQWLSSVRGKTERITVKDKDNDQRIFYTRLAKALIKLAAGEKQNLHQTADSVDSFDKLLDIIGLLPNKNPRCYFVLDDLHMLKNKEILAGIPAIVSRLPGCIRCLLAGRSEPAQGLTETGLFGVITKDDLLFSPEEIEWLGAEKDRELNPEQIGKLLKITGGWAIYLSAVLSGREAPDKRGKTPQTLTQYLESRIWEQWDHETKILLLRLSVPDEITPELCGRLTGQPDGRGVLERLTKKENAFLIHESADLYRFHDVFHDFLTEHIGKLLSKDEIRRLNGIAAEWFYEQGNFYTSARHCIRNGDHEGINRCMDATTLYNNKTSVMSVLNRLDFFKQHVLSLSPAFIAENPYLVSKCVIAAYYDGDIETYLHYTDILYGREHEISSKHPNLMGSYFFVTNLDFRVPLKEGVKKVYRAMSSMPRGGTAAEPKEAKTTTITQNLPYFHRSMRDFSEYHDLQEKDLTLLRISFGTMIGRDYAVMEPLIPAGIHYERGESLEAARHSLASYNLCRGDTHPETAFSAHMILSAVLYAMGALRESERVMEITGSFINQKAEYLRPNFSALTFERAIRGGDKSAAREWLTVYANRSARLPFYQLCRHFTTLRSHIAVKDYAEAAAFGTRLLTLVTEYNRPLDQIETGLLLAIALWRNGENAKAVKQLEQAVNTALPYGFNQLFISDGKELLPILWASGRDQDKPAELIKFTENLKNKISLTYGFNPNAGTASKLSRRQRDMLTYLSKGMTYNEIAAATGLTRGTVKAHVLLVYKRLEVHDAEEAVIKAKMLGII